MRRGAHAITRARGFTLVEVLAAITILGMGLFILLQSQWSALNMHTVMNDEVTFGEFVETVVGKAEIGVVTGMLSDNGDFGALYPDYSWSYDASLSGDSEDPENQLYEVLITIEGPEKSKELTFYLYNNNPENKEGGIFGGGDNFGKQGFGTQNFGDR